MRWDQTVYSDTIPSYTPNAVRVQPLSILKFLELAYSGTGTHDYPLWPTSIDDVLTLGQ